ncbi:stretch-activated cation channel MID1 isoform X1 [Selaginella moellendorffii]|uniref:stretch-activated cation channel MID1 isoform X1 n=1 Tax=Selaginella moellendorffii TaxID=88036 RepID=UPI000D1C9097|nr:stretch-activated cation channel MID1 isoform X1 [Selaginella moellendorffii]|eukprot:XP_024533158.1 stretch-activated cation channel MID1 isoform X1 [Selaginella moellendorffii]
MKERREKLWQDLLSLGNCRDVTLWTCNDCIAAYTTWMCAIQFPKCIPYPFHFSIPRKNATTNPKAGMKADLIWGYGGTSPDYVVNPCFDLCYDVVRKCPPSLQFTVSCSKAFSQKNSSSLFRFTCQCPTDTRSYGDKSGCNDLV